MAKKYYVVWEGRQKGIFTDWNQCKQQIDKFAGARYKSYKTRPEAEAAYRMDSATALKKKPAAVAKKSRAGGLKTYTAEEIFNLPQTTKIFTDGGCEPNPGKAASGLAVYRSGELSELWYGLFNPQGTNNTAELNALHQALLMAEEEIRQNRSVAIFSDSKYSIQCVTQWAAGWQKKGWVKKDGEIKNLEIIQEMFALWSRMKSSVQVLHVNGHVGVEGNELADRMSIHGIDNQSEELSLFEVPENLKKVLAMRKG